ncbi:MAG TPA: VWA-like domain-containing protein [Burkholderiaceae bacterium]|nr:VWA-like domain-containing protein [Burkholderiaceae bacterium]
MELADANPRHRGTRAIERIVEFAPSTGALALWIAHRDVDDPAQREPIVTDGREIRYAASFDGAPLPLQSGLVAHAVLHVALRHPQRALQLRDLAGDVDLELFNVCADAIVNSALDHLAWLALPNAAVRLERLLAVALGIEVDPVAALLEWDVERLYRAIDDRRTPPAAGTSQARDRRGEPDRADDAAAGGVRRVDGPRASRVRALGAGRCADLVAGDAMRRPAEEEAEQARTWSERILRGHASDGAHSILRALIADAAEPATPWPLILRTRLARALAPRRAVSWSRPARSYLANQGRAGPHRRMPWEPGVAAMRSAPRLAVIVDVSGSIDAPLLEQFAAELRAIVRRTEAGLVLVVGDDQVRRVEQFPAGRGEWPAIDFRGGGGTDFAPLLEEADRHRPDIGVVLTDLDGPAGFEPRWPVIWAVPETARDAVAPFGRLLWLK